MQKSQAKFYLIKRIALMALLCLSVLFISLGVSNFFPKQVQAANFTKIAHYEFNGSSSLGVDSTGNNNLTNSGVTYDEATNSANFGTSGYLYASTDSNGKDFSDNVTGSYSVSFRIYTIGAGNGGNCVYNTNGFDGSYTSSAGLSLAYGGFHASYPSGGDSVQNHYFGAVSGQYIFSDTAAWYRIHNIYDSTANTMTVIATKEGDSSYSYTNTKTLTEAVNFGGSVDTVVENKTVPGYVFTIGGQSAGTSSFAEHISMSDKDNYSPKISDFRVYTGVIDSTEMAAIAEYDKTEGSQKASLVAHYDFKDANDLGKDVSGHGYNLTNNGYVQHDPATNSATFGYVLKNWNNNTQTYDLDASYAGILYAPASNDFSTSITGSFSVSFRAYLKSSYGGTNWIYNTTGWDFNSGGLSVSDSGFCAAITTADGNYTLKDNESGSNSLFTSQPDWYRVHYIYDATSSTVKIIATRDGLNENYSFAQTKTVTSAISFGGNNDYTFTLGGQSSEGNYFDSGAHITYVSDNSNGSDSLFSPKISDFRVYEGILNQTQMAEIKEYDGKEIKFSSLLFQDGMILQREKNVEISGITQPNTEVTVKFNGQTKVGTTDSSGNFSVYLDPMIANATGQTLTVETSYASKSISNVIVGEVYMGLGQSNMAYPMFEFTYCESNIAAGNWSTMENITTQYEQIKYSNDISSGKAIQDYLNKYSTNVSKTRYFNVQHGGTNDMRLTYNQWICPTSVSDLDTADDLHSISFTAVAYALQLQEKLGVPVAVVVAAHGGSRVREWVDPAEKNVGGVAEAMASDSGVGKYYSSGIAPILKYTCRGVLWYQGESDIYDISEAANYVNQVKWLMNEFKEWQNDQDIHALIYQLPQFYGHNAACYWSAMRFLQKQIADENPNTYLVSGIDTGDYCNIHPTDKFEFNARAVGVALKEIYKQSYSGSGYYGEASTAVSASKTGSNLVTIKFDDNTTALSVGSGTKAPLYLSNSPVAFTTGSQIQTNWATTTTNYSISGSTITLNTDYKYISFGLDNTYADDIAWVKNQYGLVIAPFMNIEVIDNAVNLTVENGANGTITGAETKAYAQNTILNNITVTANTGYKIASVTWNNVSVTGFDASTNPTTFTFNQTITANSTLKVTYEQIKYVATVTNTATSGSVSGIVNGNEYVYGQTLNISITANSGYTINTVTFNGQAVTVPADATTLSFTKTVGTENPVLVVTYTSNFYQVSVTSANGTVTGFTPNTDIVAGTVLNNIQITANQGYKIVSIKWNNNPITVTNPAQMTIPSQTLNGNATLEVLYEKITFTVTVNNDNDKGSVNGVTSGTAYDLNTSLTISVTTNTGYDIAEISINGVTQTVADLNSFSVSKTLTENLIISVTYAPEKYRATVTADSHANVINLEDGAEYSYGSSFVVGVSASANYKIKSVKLNGLSVTISNDRAFTFNVTVEGAITLVVETEKVLKNFNLTISNNNSQGTVTGATNNSTHVEDSEITFTVAANEGYNIKTIKFGDKTISVTNKKTLTFKERITKDTLLVVTYEKIQTPTPDTNNGNGTTGGTTDGTNSGTSTDNTNESKGCGSSITSTGVITMSAVLILTATALIVKRKKEN